MIGLILGTSEGKKILSLLNKYTDDIFVSTSTTYGGELLKDYSYKVINTKPLNLNELVDELKKNNVEILIDASHPYAAVITENAIEACSRLKIHYIRYERKSVVSDFEDKIIKVKDYDELGQKLKEVEGNILNTTGSRNIAKFMDMKLENRIIHRVLPSIEVMIGCFSLGVKTEDIIAIKGPVSYELNVGFLKEYDAKAIILKDSGKAGGTEEKLKAAFDLGVQAFVIERKKQRFDYLFSDEEELVNYIRESGKI